MTTRTTWFFISFLFLLAAGDSYLEDGCFYINGDLFGCMKITVLSCDQQWFFQLIAPLDQESSYVMADGLVSSGTDFFQCYAREQHCEFCLEFTDNHVDGTKMTSSATITIFCPFGSEEINFGQFSTHGVPCGESGYFYLPCEFTLNEQQYYSVFLTSASIIDDLIARYLSSANNRLTLTDAEGCIYLNSFSANDHHSFPVQVPLYCPSIVMDTCTMQAILESRSGIQIQLLLDESIQTSCTDVGGGQMCIEVQDTKLISLENTVRVNTLVTVSLLNDYQQVIDHASSALQVEFPNCGYDASGTCQRNIEDSEELNSSQYSRFSSQFFLSIINKNSDSITNSVSLAMIVTTSFVSLVFLILFVGSLVVILKIGWKNTETQQNLNGIELMVR